MNFRVSGTLTAHNSEKYRMSIRLSPGGLSFVGHIPLQPKSFFYRSVELDRSRPYAHALQEVSSEHPFFLFV